MVNRPDALTRPGGDTVQMLKTKEALEKLGVYVEIAIGAQTPDFYASFDLVHIFNVQTYNFSLAEARKAKKAGRPIALSPIFWDFWNLQDVVEGTAYWSPKWRVVRKLFGWNLTKALRKGYWLLVYIYKSRQMYYKIKLLLEMADILLPNSKAEMDLLRRQFHLGSETVFEVVPNAVDTDLFNPYRDLPLPTKLAELGIESGQYVLEVARIEPCKNQLALIEATKKLGFPLVLIGPEVDEVYVRECKRASDGYPVYFLGPVPHEELAAYYFHAKVHALPSWRETPGLASLEAAAMGCNIVTTLIGSAEEYFGDSAWYCNPFDQESIVAAVREAYAGERSNRLQKRVRELYTWYKAAQFTLLGYEEANSAYRQKVSTSR